jgi:glucosamine 6-phosphate synthetase-like amidotransferase/phosphosugar isomerase protein
MGCIPDQSPSFPIDHVRNRRPRGLPGSGPLLLEGLRQLEYRGYDSAGIATVNGEQQLSCLRAEGKLVNLT